MLYISRWKAMAILLTTLVVCLFAVPNFLSPSDRPELAEMGAAPRRARPRPAGRLAPPARGRYRGGPQGEGRAAARRRAQGPARGARSGSSSAPVMRGNTVEVRIRESDLQQGLTKLRELSQPLGGLLSATGQRSRRDHQCRRRARPPDLDRAGDPRARPPGGRPVDPDRDAPRRRARHRRAGDPAPGRRPHPGAGARPAGSAAPDRAARQDRQARLPHGRPDDDGRAGAGDAAAAGIGSSLRHRRTKAARPT